MYEAFYGIRQRPFELTSNPRFLFLTSRHREALSNLDYGIAARKSITLLLGEAGTGKTTLIRATLDSARRANLRCVYMSNPALTRSEFIEFLAQAFGLTAAAAASKTVLLRELERVLRDRLAERVVMPLVIDEAQSLSHELLEEIRLLANIENDSTKLLPVVLVGQPELRDRLNEPSLRQLKQRVCLRCELAPLTLEETAAYIAARIRAAGGESAAIFTPEAVVAIQRHSRGIPRTINVICDNALVTGFAIDRRPIDADVIGDVCCDFDLLGGDDLGCQASDARLAAGVEEAVTGPARSAARVSRIGEPDGGPMFGVFNRPRRFSFF